MIEPNRKLPLAEGPPLPDKVVAIDEALQDAKLPHAIGGALALAYYAEPRATIDIDLNLFIPTDRWQEVVGTLEELGVDAGKLDPTALQRDGQCRLRWGNNPVDLFFAYDPFHEAMRKEVRRVPFAATTLPILAPEHLAVCKAMFDRPKDWLDIEQMLIATEDLDVSAIEDWLSRMVGDDGERLKRLEELRAKLPAN